MHLSYEGTKLVQGVESKAPAWYLIASLGAFAFLGFVSQLYRHIRRVDQRRLLTTVGFPLVQIVCVTLSVVSGVFFTFATAYAATLMILIWIYVAAEFGLVNYDVSNRYFVLNRSTLYASVRAVTQFLVLRAGVPVRVGRLVPFMVASFETCGMFNQESKAYDFSVTSPQFATYMTMKSVIFILLPLLEEFILSGNIPVK